MTKRLSDPKPVKIIASGICPIDGKPFTYAFIAGSNSKIYCSNKCSKKAARKRMFGTDSELLYVYGLMDIRTREFFYVGRAKNIGERFYQHLHGAWEKNTNSKYRAKMKELKAAGVRPVLCLFEMTIDTTREDFHIEALRAAGPTGQPIPEQRSSKRRSARCA